MAPIKKRSSIRAKAASAGHTAPTTTTPTFPTHLKPTPQTANNKTAKRISKHNDLISRIEKANRKPLKRRRPGKKLVGLDTAALNSLASALPELEEDEEEDDEWEGIDDDEDEGEDDDEMKMDDSTSATTTVPKTAAAEGDVLGELSKMVRVTKRKSGGAEGEGKMKMKTLKSRPGALKRKQKLEERERERFGKNLAGMSVAPAATAVGAGQGGDATSSRWQALRGFIGQTLETNKAFKK